MFNWDSICLIRFCKFIFLYSKNIILECILSMSSSFKCFTGVQVEFLNNFPNILMNHSFAKVVKNVYIFVGNNFSILQIKKEICNCNFHINYTEKKRPINFGIALTLVKQSHKSIHILILKMQ